MPADSVVGVLALQGDFERHKVALERQGLAAREIRHASEIAHVSGLVLPGGESTAMLRLFESEPWEEALRAFAESGRPIFATCAGIILLARMVSNPSQRCARPFGCRRRAQCLWTADRLVRGSGDQSIRQLVRGRFHPRAKNCPGGTGVEVLARVGDDPVLVREGNITAATYHPELSPASAIHAEIFGALTS